MDRHRTLDSSMSSLYSGSNVSQTPSRHLEPNAHNYPTSSAAPSPTPSHGQSVGAGQLMQQISQNDSIGSASSSQGLRATTIGTVVVRCGPIQLVIALLQSIEKLYIKVVELEPKITTLGGNLDESLRLQSDHDETLRNVQNLPGPMEEFVHKADKLLASKRIGSELVNAMADTLNVIWGDILHLLQDRSNILHMCTQFHEQMLRCQRRMDDLEGACLDTMIPIEVKAVQEFLGKFKQLRIDMLTAVMAALKDGNELLAQLQEIENMESLDTRPEHIKRDAARAVHQVQLWLESLHDRRNALETAWQTRKTQLEQCLALALLGRELVDVEASLQKLREEISVIFSLGECEHTANLSLQNYRDWKQQALQLRDRALKITRAKEKLQSAGTFSGDEACSRAYNILSACTEHLDLVDQREHWLQQSRDFFSKADNTLKVLEKLDVELSNVKLPPNSPESYAMYSKVARDVRNFTEDPLRLGYSILDEVGRTKQETQGIKRVLDEIENRKAYIEGICSNSNEDQKKVEQALKEFLMQYNDLLEWLLSSGQQYLQQNVYMGKNLEESKHFLLQHHELMQDLEIKGELINLLLESIKTHLESLSAQQRYDVDSKAESLHKHWIELKDLVLKRVDCVSLLINFFEKANEFANQLENLKRQLAQTPNEQKIQFLEDMWQNMKTNFSDLKNLGTQFLQWKILDPYLDTKSSANAVEDILNGFSKQQIDVTTSFENWTTHITEKREVETILERIMSQNEETAAKTTNVDTQLYPIFTSPSVDSKHLHKITSDKLKLVLQDIDQAQNEIQERVHTTLGIQTKDPEAMQKIEQVISNLRTLKAKLEGIRYDYKTVVENCLQYLENITKLHQEITQYFNRQQQQQQNDSNDAIEQCLAEHEKFRDVCMERFRSLITQSEILIDRVRALEPAGAKEIDTDRILKLLENLRMYFECCNGERMSSLEKLERLEKFKNDLLDINRSLDSVSRQLQEINGQNVDSLAAAKTTSLAFEYFERTIECSLPTILKPTRHELRWACYLHPMELLEKRIEKFTESTTQQLLISNPESEAYFREELRKLTEKWQQFREQVKSKRNSLNQATEFFEVVEKIDCEHREISYFYNSISNKITYIRDPVEASNLVNDIEKYVKEREAPLREKLDNAAKCSHDMNKVSQLYNDVMNIFQSFMKLKSDITIVHERLKNEEKLREQQEREAREQAERERIVREAEARERAAREQEARLLAYKEQAARESAERERLARELAAREQAIREEEQRLQMAREQASREQALREQQIREEEENRIRALREQEARLQAAREQAMREQMAREQQLREEEQNRLRALREEEARLQAVREQTMREQMQREQMAREEEIQRLKILREEESRLHSLREQSVREEEARLNSLREQARREEESRLVALKDHVNREESLQRMQNFTEKIDQKHFVTENIRKDIEIKHIFTEIKYASPMFVRPLRDAITRENEKFTFECEVTATPDPDIEWFKDGILIQNNPDYKTSYDKGLCRLEIEETFAADSARFTCKASNLVGNASTSATLSVRENAPEAQMIPPRFVRYLQSSSAKEGSSFEFSCVVTGHPLPTVSWYKNDKCIDDSADYVISYNNGEALLRFEEVFLEDDAVYTCSATNPAGIEHCSASLLVEPLEPTEVPYFKIPLNNAMARVGQKVKLEALIGGIPRPEINWLYNGKPYFPRNVKYEYGRVTLIIPQAYPNDAGVYVLTAKNLAGEAYSSCNVIVKGRLPHETSDSEMASDMEPIKPTVQLSLKDVSIVEGNSVRLDCVIVGQPEPEVIWYHNEKPIKESADMKLLFQGDKCSLIMQEAFQEDAGEYKVVAINSAGEASSSCNVKVTPAATKEESSNEKSIEKTVIVETKTEQVSNGNQAEEEEEEEVVEEVVVEDVGEDEEEDKEDVNHGDAGRYAVTASNVAGQATTTADLIVKKSVFPPVFGKRLQAQVMKKNERIIMEVEVTGLPEPTVVWMKDDRPLHEAGLSQHRLLVNGNAHTLIIEKGQITDSGKYMVKATNAGGEAKSIADCAILEPTPERMQEVVKTVVYERPDAFTTEMFNKEPLSFESHKTESTKSSDMHGLSESKIVTEHRCTTEATMRLEHKPDYSDLPDRIPRTNNIDVTDHGLPPSQLPQQPFSATPEYAPVVTPKPHVTFQDNIDTGEMSTIDTEEKKKSSFEYFKKIDQVIKSADPNFHTYIEENAANPEPEPAGTIIPVEIEPEVNPEDLTLRRGSPPEMCFAPKTENVKVKPPAINERIKQLEEIKLSGKEPPTGGIPIFPPKPGTPKPSLEGLAMEKLWTPTNSHFDANKSATPTGDLSAPFLVQQASKTLPNASPATRPKTPIEDIDLHPGTPPEMCFAPKTEMKHRTSIVEAMEKTIEEKLIQSRPAKVYPMSVPTVTPIPPVSTPHAATYRPPPPVIPNKLHSMPMCESDYESDRWKCSGSESDENSFRTPLKSFQAPIKTNGYAADTEDMSNMTKHMESSVSEKKSFFENGGQTTTTMYSNQGPDKQESYLSKENRYHHEDKGYSVTSMTKNVSYNMSSSSGGPPPSLSQPLPQQPPVSQPISHQPYAAQPSPIPAQRKTPAEFSDYCSEVDERFRSVSRASDNEIKGYRVVYPPTPKPVANGHKSPVVVVTPSPMEFDPAPPMTGPSYAAPQPKFGGYQAPPQSTKPQFVPHHQPSHVFKPKPVAAKFLAAAAQQQQQFAPPPQPIPRDFRQQPPPRVANPQYYTATPSLATETKNCMQMKESSESCNRVVNMQQTKRTMHFDNQQNYGQDSYQQQSYGSNNYGQQYQQPLEQFPYSPTPSPRGTPGRQRCPPPATPTKFVPGHFRESTYNGDSGPLWVPMGPNGPLRYRHVEAPQGRSTSLPRSYERVLSPMEFDRGPEMPSKIQVDVNTIRRDRANNSGHQSRTQSLNRNSSMRSNQQQYQQQQYQQQQYQSSAYDQQQGYQQQQQQHHQQSPFPRDTAWQTQSDGNWQSQADHQGRTMSSSFKQKTQKFVEEVKGDIHNYSSSSSTTTNTKSNLVNGGSTSPGFRVAFQRAPSEGETQPQAYRDESRVSQYGTKCIDPKTGLVYFKYDFGYEFGILFPGEGHKFVAAQRQKQSQSTLPTSTSAFTQPWGNKNLTTNRRSPYPLAGGRELIIPVQHERTSATPSPIPPQRGYYSDTETSKYCGKSSSSFRSVTPQYQQSTFAANRLKKRFSLPNTQTQTIDINIDRLHSGDSLNNLNSLPISGPGYGQDMANYVSREEFTQKAPIFITPLKDHAVAAGQTARFECIVQSHPQPNVIWTRNGYNLENSNQHVVEYRNGVCRLTIPRAYPDDAGSYSCTATNPLGTATSNAVLSVKSGAAPVVYHIFK